MSPIKKARCHSIEKRKKSISADNSPIYVKSGLVKSTIQFFSTYFKLPRYRVALSFVVRIIFS